MSNERQLRRLLSQYGISAECGRGFLTYLGLLEKWNNRINLVSSTSWDIVGPLFEEGIWAGQFYPRGVVRHLDIGSGAGFPALSLCLLNSDMHLRMVESHTKRAVFLETACEALFLKRASVFHGTLETLLKSSSEGDVWDCVSWKAVRLRRKDFTMLARRAATGTAFWIFQGVDVPVEGGIAESSLKLECTREVPNKPAWQLSIYHKRP